MTPCRIYEATSGQSSYGEWLCRAGAWTALDALLGYRVGKRQKLLPGHYERQQVGVDVNRTPAGPPRGAASP